MIANDGSKVILPTVLTCPTDRNDWITPKATTDVTKVSNYKLISIFRLNLYTKAL